MHIYHWDQLNTTEKRELLKRPKLSVATNIIEQTQAIIQQVRTKGDFALIHLTAQYDQAQLAELRVNPAEFVKAEQHITPTLKRAIEFAKNQIANYHRTQLPHAQSISSHAGVVCERQARPLQRVGLYVPGGS